MIPSPSPASVEPFPGLVHIPQMRHQPVLELLASTRTSNVPSALQTCASCTLGKGLVAVGSHLRKHRLQMFVRQQKTERCLHIATN